MEVLRTCGCALLGAMEVLLSTPIMLLTLSYIDSMLLALHKGVPCYRAISSTDATYRAVALSIFADAHRATEYNNHI